MNATQRAKKRKRAEQFALERERMHTLSHSDSRTVQHAPKDVLPKRKAKSGKLEIKHIREGERFASRWKGDALATGKDSQGRFRTHDLPFRMSAPCWVRRGEQ